jgi:hypothetical protein
VSINMPPELQWLGYIAGSAWPQGDEDQMWSLAKQWYQAHDDLQTLLPDLHGAITAALKAYPSGDGGDQISTALNKLADGDNSIPHLADLLNNMGDAADGMGTEIEYMKLMIITSLAELAFEILLAWIFPPTAPAVEAAAVAGTRAILRLVYSRTIGVIERLLGKVLGQRLASFLVRHVALSTLLGAAQDLLIQAGQVAAGHRKGGINWQQVGITAASAAAAGAAGGVVGKLVDKGFHYIPSPTRFAPVADVGKGLVAGAVSGMAGAGAGYLMGTGVYSAITGTNFGDNIKSNWGNQTITSGASAGGLAGGFKAGANSWGASRIPRPGGVDVPSFDGSAVSSGNNSSRPPSVTSHSDPVVSQDLSGAQHSGNNQPAGSAGGHGPIADQLGQSFNPGWTLEPLNPHSVSGGGTGPRPGSVDVPSSDGSSVLSGNNSSRPPSVTSHSDPVVSQDLSGAQHSGNNQPAGSAGGHGPIADQLGQSFNPGWTLEPLNPHSVSGGGTHEIGSGQGQSVPSTASNAPTTPIEPATPIEPTEPTTPTEAPMPTPWGTSWELPNTPRFFPTPSADSFTAPPDLAPDFWRGLGGAPGPTSAQPEGGAAVPAGASALQQNGDRAVVNQRGVHVGTEPPGRNGGAQVTHGRGESVDQRFSDRAGSSGGPGGPTPLAGVGVEGELADHQDGSVQVSGGALTVQNPKPE